ncbi:hypothetical protein ACROYT_G004414 [Oculina patagonica]
MNVVAILLLSALTYSAANDCSVMTEDGQCCHFPFLFAGYQFHSCTTYGWYREWCSLTDNYDRDGQWGNCADNPPTTAPPVVTTPAPPPPPTTSGGVSSSGGNCGSKPVSSRIVGGDQAQKDSWPWQAVLASPGGSQFCGGSLIHEQWVVTASHCVEGSDASQIVVRMGAYKITDIAQELQVEKIIKHESYHRLCVPLARHRAPKTEDQSKPWRWGTLSSGGSQPDYLQEASVPIVSQGKCKEAYGESNIHDSMICAGLDAGGVDACQGDSGGPMVCEFNGKWYLEGATSWGHGCAAAGKYGVYAKVRYLKTWVQNKMSSN